MIAQKMMKKRIRTATFISGIRAIRMEFITTCRAEIVFCKNKICVWKVFI